MHQNYSVICYLLFWG